MYENMQKSHHKSFVYNTFRKLSLGNNWILEKKNTKILGHDVLSS